MSNLTEAYANRDFIVSYESNRCFEEVTVASGENLDQGAVLGRLTKRAAAAPIPTVVGTGNGTMTLLSFGPYAKVGNYVITCTATASNSGTFSVVDPDSVSLGSATVGTAFESDQIRFLLNDGSTDFAVADAFTVAVTAGGTPAVVGTGNGTIGSISIGADAQNGTYKIVLVATASNSGVFEVRSPEYNGVVGLIGHNTVAAAFVSRHVNFTIADGSTDFALGDYFNIVVATNTNKVKAWSPTATDGTQDVCGVLVEDTGGALTADKKMVMLCRDAEVNQDELSWTSGMAAGIKTMGMNGLKSLGIICRA